MYKGRIQTEITREGIEGRFLKDPHVMVKIKNINFDVHCFFFQSLLLAYLHGCTCYIPRYR